MKPSANYAFGTVSIIIVLLSELLVIEGLLGVGRR